ncbi:hypothetical protein [Amycolatopsis rifamycinica]|uniref:hypothetical protein n=1 Tax=Amycolatopsis rifamycinica TaxID=287986 RepID=UPI001269B0A6|nr:hypothetical protein [Amycolatopsis rifamycinica]
MPKYKGCGDRHTGPVPGSRHRWRGMEFSGRRRSRWLVTGLPVALLVAPAALVRHRRAGARDRDEDHVR